MANRRPSAPTRPPAPVSPAFWLLPLVLAVTLLVFWPALHFQFVYDDRVQIAANPSIYSWSHIPEYFRSHVWGFTHVWTNYYRPLFLVALRLCHSIVGLDTVGWHAFPNLVHLINVGLAFAVAKKLSKDTITGLITAALFAVNPVHTEAVAWISGMTDPLMAVPLLGGFWCYLAWAESQRPVWIAAASLCFMAALLTKESAIVFPLVLAAYEVIVGKPSEAEERRTWQRPFAMMVAIVLGYLLVRYLVLGSFLGSTVVPTAWTTVVFTAPSSILRFLRFVVVPYGMSAFYDAPYVTRTDLHFFMPLLVLTILAAGVWLWSRKTRAPLIAFSAIWALIGVLPVLDIRLMQEGDFVHIRFLYLPCLALSLLVAIALRQLLSKPKPRLAVAGALFIALAITTSAQIGFFESNETMYKRGIAIAPDNRVPKNNLADDYIRAGRYDEALALLDDVLRRHPDFWMANYNVGFVAHKRGDWTKAADYMGRSIADHGEEVDAYVYRGFALLKLGRLPEAEQSVRQAIALRPSTRSYHFVLGLILRQEQRWQEALAAFENELQINPQDVGAAQHAADLRTRLGAAAGK